MDLYIRETLYKQSTWLATIEIFDFIFGLKD
jgi:hypothetical protein